MAAVQQLSPASPPSSCGPKYCFLLSLLACKCCTAATRETRHVLVALGVPPALSVVFTSHC